MDTRAERERRRIRMALIAFVESVEEGIGWDDLIDETVEKILSLSERV